MNIDRPAVVLLTGCVDADPHVYLILRLVTDRRASKGKSTSATNTDRQAVRFFGLGSGDQFGSSVALNGVGDRLAVGALGDDGATDTATDAGGVRLFSFTDTTFSGGVHEGTMSAGYTGAKDVDVALDSGDQFGYSVSLNGAGDRLAVGAPADDGAANALTNGGAVYLFSFADANFSGGVLEGTMGAGYAGGKNVDVAALEVGDGFGISAALNGAGDRLAVGVWGDDGAGNAGEVYLFDFADTSFIGSSQVATCRIRRTLPGGGGTEDGRR